MAPEVTTQPVKNPPAIVFYCFQADLFCILSGAAPMLTMKVELDIEHGVNDVRLVSMQEPDPEATNVSGRQDGTPPA